MNFQFINYTDTDLFIYGLTLDDSNKIKDQKLMNKLEKF